MTERETAELLIAAQVSASAEGMEAFLERLRLNHPAVIRQAEIAEPLTLADPVSAYQSALHVGFHLGKLIERRGETSQ